VSDRGHGRVGAPVGRATCRPSAKDTRLHHRSFYPKSAPAVFKGNSFENILRYGLEQGEYVEALGREDASLAERLERHQASDQTVYQHLADGRRLQIIERKTENGGRVGLRVDVTDYIQSQERAERAERQLVDAIAALPAGFGCSTETINSFC